MWVDIEAKMASLAVVVGPVIQRLMAPGSVHVRGSLVG